LDVFYKLSEAYSSVFIYSYETRLGHCKGYSTSCTHGKLGNDKQTERQQLQISLSFTKQRLWKLNITFHKKKKRVIKKKTYYI